MALDFVKFMFSKKATKNYKILNVDLTLTKGQLISECPFVFKTSSKKTNEISALFLP